MAGGVGSRFWPESRSAKPKQFLNLLGERSMIQMTVDRIRSRFTPDRILVVTNATYVALVREQLPDLPAENIIGEPVAKNTAPCVALAARILRLRDADATMLVLPADHHIARPEVFLSVVDAAFEQAEAGTDLVTIGITPHRPETGYGYIQADERATERRGAFAAHRVKAFAEKPDLDTALRFLASGDFLWNSGMFIWRADTVEAEFARLLPDMHVLAQALPDRADPGFTTAVDTFYRSVNSISIDYGIMEKAGHVRVVPGDFGWSDVGSWTAVHELGRKDPAGNVDRSAGALFIGSANCLVKTSSDRFVALVGLDGIALVETDDTLMVCRLDAAQDVKKVVDALKDSPKDHLR